MSNKDLSKKGETKVKTKCSEIVQNYRQSSQISDKFLVVKFNLFHSAGFSKLLAKFPWVQ